MEIEIPPYVPEAVLQKVERGSTYLAILARDVRRAQDPGAKDRAERALCTSYALEVHATGRDMELQILPEESDALLRTISGAGYRELPLADPAAELQARKDASANVFAEEAQRWKTGR